MNIVDKKILVTGSDGFIGRNLCVALAERGCKHLLKFNRSTDIDTLADMINACDVIFHLAGENRPSEPEDFEKTNVELTRKICDLLLQSQLKNRKTTRFIHISSSQYDQDNDYGRSKKRGERVVEEMTYACTDCTSTISRLPGVFGKWAKPNYNSVVATFCYNIMNGIPIQIDTPERNCD